MLIITVTYVVNGHTVNEMFCKYHRANEYARWLRRQGYRPTIKCC